MKQFEGIKKLIHYPLTIVFSAFLLSIAILSVIIPDRELSEWENRYLTKAPEVRIADIADGSFMTKYENYINDQMPFRDGFIKLKASIEAVFLKIENNSVARGKDSYLFTKSESKTDVFDKNISIISEFIKNTDNDVTVAIAPNAAGILTKKVPKGMIIPNQKEKLSELMDDKSLLSGARVVDLSCVLLTHEDEYIYYKTDHHWTTLGAYYAYEAISDDPLDLSVLSKGEKGGFLGTLYAKYKGLFVKPDVITYYDIPIRSFVTDDTLRNSLLDIEKLSVFDKYGMFLYGNFGKSEIVSDESILSEEGKGKKLIIFKDSYANCLIPFLTHDYEYITLIDLRYYKDSVKELVENNKDADILFINNFDFLNEDNHFYKLMK